VIAARRLAAAFCASALVAVAAPAGAATLTVTTTSAADTADGQCDILEAAAAAATQQPVHGDCPAGDGDDRIVLAAGAIYPIAQTLRVTGAVHIAVDGGGTATIAPGGSWSDDPADRWSDCAIFVAGDGATLAIDSVAIAQTTSSSTPLSGLCVTAGSLQIRRGRVTGFARGGIVSLCEPASGCDHDQLGQGSSVTVYSSLIDSNQSPTDGGGISSKGVGASLIVEHSAIIDNVSQAAGGGLAYEAGWNNQRIASSTVSGNMAATGGGMYVHFAPGTNTYVYVFNSTVANNQASGAGGGIAFEGDGFTQDLNIFSSIVSNNSAGTDEVNINADWKGAQMSCSHSSLVYLSPGQPMPNPLPGAPCRYDVADARLGPLMSMGGSGALPVHPLLPGSPAIDAGIDDETEHEQRDDWIASIDPPMVDNWTLFDRVVDGDGDGDAVRDLGAYEMNLRWQTELLGVAATGPSAHEVVTAPDGFDRGAGTSYAATGATGEFVTYLLPVAEAGRYDVAVGVMKSPDAGTFRLAVADDPAGPWKDVGAVQDDYAASPTFAELGPLAAAAFTTPGEKYLRVSVAGKNDASAGYHLFLDYVRLTPGTGGVPGGGGGCGCVVGAARPDGIPRLAVGVLVVSIAVVSRRGGRRRRTPRPRRRRARAAAAPPAA